MEIVYIFILIILSLIIFYVFYNKNAHNTTPHPIDKKSTIVKAGPCVKRYWTLTEFTEKFGKMKVGNCTNHITGEVFKSCIFIKDNKYTFVNFYSDIGVLTKEEIAKRKKELKVGLNINDKYYLYAGKESFLQPVDLGV